MTAPLLEVDGLHAGYGAASVLHGIDLTVGAGEVVVVLGANGAGKTTLLRATAGLLPHTAGRILVEGQEIRRVRPDVMLRYGVGLVPQGRGTLTDMTVRDNLRVGAVSRRDGDTAADIDRWCEVFPALGQRRNQVAGTLSGGEQQMLAIARAMMARPRLLLCDEVSLGLAPVVVQGLFDVLRRLNADTGISLLLVEQNAELALEIATRVYLLEVGTIAATGDSGTFRDNDAIRHAYLGY